jgi:hypothetical protein
MHARRMMCAAVLCSLLVTAAFAQTYTKAQLQDMYSQYLTGEGYKPEITNAGNVRFRREGRSYLIFVDEKDPAYFRVATAISVQDNSTDMRAARMDAASFASEQTKVAKAHVSKDEVMFSAEMFLVVPGDFKNSIGRAFRAIDAAYDKYRVRMTELGKQP